MGSNFCAGDNRIISLADEKLSLVGGARVSGDGRSRYLGSRYMATQSNYLSHGVRGQDLLDKKGAVSKSLRTPCQDYANKSARTFGTGLLQLCKGDYQQDSIGRTAPSRFDANSRSLKLKYSGSIQVPAGHFG